MPEGLNGGAGLLIRGGELLITIRRPYREPSFSDHLALRFATTGQLNG